MIKNLILLTTLFFILYGVNAHSQDESLDEGFDLMEEFSFDEQGNSGGEELSLEEDDFDAEDLNSLSSGSPKKSASNKKSKKNEIEEEEVDLELSELEEIDDLDSLKNDFGENLFDLEKEELELEKMEKANAKTNKGSKPKVIVNKDVKKKEKIQTVIFDVGEEEKRLLELSKFVEGKIPDAEWNEIAVSSKEDKYVVQEGEWLWKISEKLFGSGFYYSKIWSLNPHITNPHEIEPGMVLVFDTGTTEELPSIKVAEDFKGKKKDSFKTSSGMFDFSQYGDKAEPEWLKERKKLLDQGVYFQFASPDTYEDLKDIGAASLNSEFEKYEPPPSNIVIKVPGEEYDAGFDKDSKITFNFKEGFFLNTFATTNIVQDLGYVDSYAAENIFIQKYDRVFIYFDESVKVKPGDNFSIYKPEGQVSHPISDRKGQRYSIVAQIKALVQKDDLWECEVTDLSGLLERQDRVTLYTPKISRIVKTFSKRSIEAAIIGSHREVTNGLNYGDVVYIDRGRADGVEVGSVFEVFGFRDRGTGLKITDEPSYKIGELSVITLTDNFATALVTNSSNVIKVGMVALTKTQEQVARARRIKNQEKVNKNKAGLFDTLEELDVELNLDNLGEDILNKADKIELTEDELEELERQEREKSVIKEHERDLRELERLEGEIENAEDKLNEIKVDEDKFLEQQNLEEIENSLGAPNPNAFESIDEIEQDIGKKYLDEDINSSENPYGLTEYDLEEIDELLNTEQ